MAPKVLRLVQSCGECPHYGYYSGGVYNCNLVDQAVLNKDVVAPFCPLADYPSRTIADQETTIQCLREPNKYGLRLGILTHIAAKLKTKLEHGARGTTIRFKDGEEEREVYFGSDYILKIDLPRDEITFAGSGGKIYRLSPDSATLWEKVDLDPKKDGWYQHRLT